MVKRCIIYALNFKIGSSVKRRWLLKLNYKFLISGLLSLLLLLLSLLFIGVQFPRWLTGEKSASNARDVGGAGLTPGSGGSPGGGDGSPLQHSCWRIPWTEEPSELQFIGSQRVGHD